MELMELYNRLQNPLDNPKTIEKLIHAYANSAGHWRGFYGDLVTNVQKNYNRGSHYQEDRDEFHAMLFNKWKNSIVAVTSQEYAELYRRGSYGDDFIKMRNYLKTIPDVSTMKEADEIFYGKKGDSQLEEALEKYSWRHIGSDSEWTHVMSRYLTAKKDIRPTEEHRLYLNTELQDTYKMVTYLVEKFDAHHIPYYFKFAEYSDRADTIVIYSSTENLTKCVEILQEIKREHPDLISRLKEPPILTGKIERWLGYGSEPDKLNGESQSFNSIRSRFFLETIGKATKQWIVAHLNQQIVYQGQGMSFQDYLAMKSTEKLISSLENQYLYSEKYEKDNAKRKGTTYNSAVLNDRYGYTLQDVRSSQFKQNVYRELKDKMPDMLSKVFEGGYGLFEGIKMNVRNGKQISFYCSDLERVIQKLSINISKNDPNYIETIKTAARNNAKKYGIDGEKICFDIKARDRIKAVAAQTKQTVPSKIVTPERNPAVKPATKQKTEYELLNEKVDALAASIPEANKLINYYVDEYWAVRKRYDELLNDGKDATEELNKLISLYNKKVEVEQKREQIKRNVQQASNKFKTIKKSTVDSLDNQRQQAQVQQTIPLYSADYANKLAFVEENGSTVRR